MTAGKMGELSERDEMKHAHLEIVAAGEEAGRFCSWPLPTTGSTRSGVRDPAFAIYQDDHEMSGKSPRFDGLFIKRSHDRAMKDA